MQEKRTTHITDLSLVSPTDPCLRWQCNAVQEHEFGSKELRDLVVRMTDILKIEGGLGLAANQVGVNKRVFVCVGDGDYVTHINPEIDYLSNDTTKSLALAESCLSMKDISMPIKRPNTIRLTSFNRHGEQVVGVYTGLTAVVIQHEFDHLNGIRFFDRASQFKRKRLIKKLKKFERLDYVSVLEDSLVRFP